MIDHDDISRLKEIFVTREECDRDMKSATMQNYELDKRLTILEHGQKINNWLTGAIAAGIVSLVIKIFLGG